MGGTARGGGGETEAEGDGGDGDILRQLFNASRDTRLRKTSRGRMRAHGSTQTKSTPNALEELRMEAGNDVLAGLQLD